MKVVKKNWAKLRIKTQNGNLNHNWRVSTRFNSFSPKVLTPSKPEHILFLPDHCGGSSTVWPGREGNAGNSQKEDVCVSVTRPLCIASDKETENQRKADDKRKITRSCLTSVFSQSDQPNSVETALSQRSRRTSHLLQMNFELRKPAQWGRRVCKQKTRYI